MTLDPAEADRIAAALDSAMVDVMRPLATALQRTPADVWRNPDASGGRRGAPVLHHADIRVRITTPNMHELKLLADLGAEKATMIGRLAWNEDVQAGDELHVGATIYQVERVARGTDKTLCALWELQS